MQGTCTVSFVIEPHKAESAQQTDSACVYAASAFTGSRVGFNCSLPWPPAPS
jgi:hypothetical protein